MEINQSQLTLCLSIVKVIIASWVQRLHIYPFQLNFNHVTITELENKDMWSLIRYLTHLTITYGNQTNGMQERKKVYKIITDCFLFLFFFNTYLNLLHLVVRSWLHPASPRSGWSRHLVWTVSGVKALLQSSSHGSHPVRRGRKKGLPLPWEVRVWRSEVRAAFSDFKACWRLRSQGHSG